MIKERLLCMALQTYVRRKNRYARCHLWPCRACFCSKQFQNGAIYEAVVTTNDGKRKSYEGLAKNFKKRFSKHEATLNDRTADGQTTLSRYFWEQSDRGKNPVVMWQYLEKNIPDFNPVSGLCKLCTREKFQIVLNPSVASLNHRTEMFAPCRHKRSYLFGEPPD